MSFSEVLVITLVSILVLDKDRTPAFLTLIKSIYQFLTIGRSAIKKLLRDAGIEDLRNACSFEKVNYIPGKDGELYRAYDMDDDIHKKSNDSKDSSSR